MSKSIAESKHDSKARRSPFWRPVLLAGVLIPLNAYWIVQMEIIRGETLLTTLSLLANVIFCLFFLTLANRKLQQYIPRLALSQPELLVTYILLAAGSAMAGLDSILVLLPNIPYAAWFASSPNQWESRILPYLPHWLTIKNREVIGGYYQGHSTLYDPAHIQAWLVPLAAWLLFILVLLWVMVCLNAIFRHQWIRSERLSYPIVQLPLDLTADGGTLFRRRALWLGFAVAGGIDLACGLRYFVPYLPQLPMLGTTGVVDLGAGWVNRPWDAIRFSPVTLYPFAVGIGFLLPMDLLFSCWFFVLFWKAEKVFASQLGYTVQEYAGFPYVHQQMLGAYIGICLLALWVSRHQLRLLWRRAWEHRNGNDTDEPLSPRIAFGGLVAGMVALVAFGSAIGLPLWMSAVFFVLYYVIALSITRMRAEMGAPVHDLHFLGPDTTLATVIGINNLQPQALVALTLLHWFNRAYRTHPMPHQLEGFKVAQTASFNSCVLPFLMIGAALWGAASACWVYLHIAYQEGAAANIRGYGAVNFGRETYSRLHSWLTMPSPPDFGALIAIIFGAATALALSVLRFRLTWFPFHALGYAIGGDYAMNFLWCSLLLSWIVKGLILRTGGQKLFLAALPFFYGLILGDFVVGGLWTLIGLALDVPAYSFWDV
jgi:hypothetical protein